jgi:SPP1 family predicted phage head-tail adaptor
MLRKQSSAQQRTRHAWAIDPGHLRCEVSFASRSTTLDSFGQPVNTWPPYYRAWAEIRQLSGAELYQGEQFTSAAQVRITIPFDPDVTINVGDRIFFNMHVYVVQIINNIEMRDFLLQLTCLEIDGSS